jgi:hypothetical protein
MPPRIVVDREIAIAFRKVYGGGIKGKVKRFLKNILPYPAIRILKKLSS